MLALVGCEKLIELTPEEEDQIAQGTSWLLLKRDKGYTQKIVTPTPTPTPRPTSTPTPSPTPKVKPSGTPGADNPDDSGGKKDNEKAFAELKEVIGIEEISLDFGGYDLYDHYEMGAVNIEPEKASDSLLIVKIIIRNNGSEDVSVNFLREQFDIMLGVDNNVFVPAYRSLIPNDFGMLETTISAGEAFESVIVFEVKNDFNSEILNLFISKEDKTVILKLK